MNKPRIIVEISGGLVSAIYTNIKEQVEIDVLDRDCYGDGAEYYDEEYTEDMESVAFEIEHDNTLVPVW